MHTGTTLTQFIIEEQRRTAGATGDFTSLLIEVVARACKAISNAVNKGALRRRAGLAPTARTCRARRRRSSTSSPTRC
ncbi:MAG: hypothetical protein MZV65_02110 [Chromatiales bacterium]|nr:hypothetical protein [Chromatiales bacterium]